MKPTQIKNSDHCRLCGNMHLDFSTGIFCGLDMKRPEFKNKCLKIDLNTTFKEKIKEVNIEYESVLKSKTDTYGHIIFFTILTVAIFILNYVLTQHIFNKGFISTLSITLLVVGFIPLGRAVGLFNSYKTNLSIAQQKKSNVDTIVKYYGYSYDIDIEHLKDSLGNIEYKVDLSIKK